MNSSKTEVVMEKFDTAATLRFAQGNPVGLVFLSDQVFYIGRLTFFFNLTNKH